MNVAKAGNRRAPQRESARSDRSALVRKALFATGWIRLDTAVASSRGSSHAVNEDWHSALGGISPLFVVADGVSSGAMASCASRELVSRLHETLERGRIDADAMRSAVLDADREVGRSIASLTDASGAATVALCAGTGASLSRWLVAWVGDCRVYRVSAVHGGPAQLLTLDDTYVDLGRDEMLLLCSDGVHKHAGPHDIARLLRGPTPLAARCVRLIEFARTSGSNDDATVLVVHRAERARARLARVVSIGALIALVATALLLLAADWVTAQRLPAAPHATVQP